MTFTCLRCKRGQITGALGQQYCGLPECAAAAERKRERDAAEAARRARRDVIAAKWRTMNERNVSTKGEIA